MENEWYVNASCLFNRVAIMSSTHLIFSLHGIQYALNAEVVREVMFLPELTLISNVPDHFAGVLNYRGHMVPVMDLNKRLGHSSERFQVSDSLIVFESDRLVMGLIVNNVSAVRNLNAQEVEMVASPGIAPNKKRRIVSQVVKLEDKVVSLLNPQALIQNHESVVNLVQETSLLSPPIDGETKDEETAQTSEMPYFLPESTPTERMVLRERALSIRQPSIGEDASEYLPLVVIRLNQDYFGIELSAVRESIDLRQIAMVPCCPEFIVGNMNLHGEVLTVVDIRALLTMPAGGRDALHKVIVVQIENLVVGILVNQIVESIFLKTGDVLTESSGGTSGGEGYARGIAPYYDGKVVTVLDLPKLLISAELKVNQSSSRQGPDQQQDIQDARVEQVKIEEKEQREFFQLESEESLEQIQKSLVCLAADPNDQMTLEMIFRDVHNVRSSARMLGIREIETIAHRIEVLLGSAKGGLTVLTPELIDRIGQGVNGINKLLDEASAGISPGPDVLSILNELSEELSMVVPKLPMVKAKVERNASNSIDTVRVNSHMLNGLMTHASELAAETIRMRACLSEVSQLVKFWENWNYEIFQHRPEKIANGGRLDHNRVMEKLSNFYNHESERVGKLGNLVGRLDRVFSPDYQRLTSIVEELEEGIREVRLFPLSQLFQLFPKMVLDMGHELSKEVDLFIEGADIMVDKQILDEMKDPLMNLMRKAIRHGIETPEERVEAGKPPKGSLQLYVFQTTTKLVIELWDDGRGLDLEAIKRTVLKKKLCGKEELASMSIGQIQSLIFAQGFSSRSLIRAHVDRLKGTIHVGSAQGWGCMVQVWLPKTVVTTHVLTVSAARQQYAIPLEYVQTTLLLNSDDLYAVEQGKALTVEGHLIPVMPLSDLLEVELNQLKDSPTKSTPANENELLPCVVIAVGDKRLGCLVDKLLAEQEVVYKPHGAILKRVRNVSGSTILSSEEVCIILNPDDLVQSARRCLADTN